MHCDGFRQRLCLTAQAHALGLVLVEVSFQILQRQREVEDADVAAWALGKSPADERTHCADAVGGTGRQRPSEDEARASDAVDLDSCQLGLGDVLGCHWGSSFVESVQGIAHAMNGFTAASTSLIVFGAPKAPSGVG